MHSDLIIIRSLLPVEGLLEDVGKSRIHGNASLSKNMKKARKAAEKKLRKMALKAGHKQRKELLSSLTSLGVAKKVGVAKKQKLRAVQMTTHVHDQLSTTIIPDSPPPILAAVGAIRPSVHELMQRRDHLAARLTHLVKLGLQLPPDLKHAYADSCMEVLIQQAISEHPVPSLPPLPPTHNSPTHTTPTHPPPFPSILSCPSLAAFPSTNTPKRKKQLHDQETFKQPFMFV